MDANGRSLPTSYEIDGDYLMQTIDTAGSAFPVVADPSVDFTDWWPPTWVITLNPADQRILLSSGGAALGAAIGAAMCSGEAPVIGTAICAAAGALIVTAVTEAFKEYGVHEGCNWKVKYTLSDGIKKTWRSGKC